MSDAKSIYVIGEKQGPVKIGISKEPLRRIGVLKKQSGRELECQFVTQATGNAGEIERQAHTHFAEHRMAGEWFMIPFDVAREFVENLFTSTAVFSTEERPKVTGEDIFWRIQAAFSKK